MRKLYIFGLVALAGLIIGLAWADQMTFTTYYPAPHGVYNDMVVMNTLGIGTTGPQSRLHVVGGDLYLGGDNATGKGNRLLKIAGDSTSTGIQLYADDYFDNNVWGTRMWKDHHGSGIGLQIDTQYGGTWYESVYIGHGQIAADPRFGVFGGATIGSGYTQVYTPPGNGLIVQGDVGIGTAAPNTKLSVRNGEISIQGTSGSYGVLGFNDTSKKLEYSNDNGTTWYEIGAASLHSAKMRRANSTQNIPGYTNTKINFDTEEYDIGDISNTATNRFVISQPGRYLVTASWGCGIGSGNTQVQVWINGAMAGRQYMAGPSGDWAPVFTSAYNLNAGDIVEMYVFVIPSKATRTGADAPQMTVSQLN